MTLQPLIDRSHRGFQRSWVADQWLSTGRFRTYINAAGHDYQLALDLYEWNARLCAAFMHDFAIFEVYLRNAIDRQLQQARHPSDQHWTNDRTLDSILSVPPGAPRRHPNNVARNKIGEARRRAGATPNRNPPSGKVVAELMFGFWGNLLSNNHEIRLWNNRIENAFPQGTDRTRLHDTVKALGELRNRVAHHEYVDHMSVPGHRQMLWVAGLLSAELKRYLETTTTVPAAISNRPRAGGTTM